MIIADVTMLIFPLVGATGLRLVLIPAACQLPRHAETLHSLCWYQVRIPALTPDALCPIDLDQYQLPDCQMSTPSRVSS